MFQYRTLEDTSIEELHKAFNGAFSDYQVKIDLPLWKFKQMLERRGYIPSKSMGAFKDGELVGFILNGCRKWEGRTTAYDTGTGVLPGYRKQGLTTGMFGKVSELLKAQGVEQYLLEVLRQNTAAYELYKKQGFKVKRSFDCYKLDRGRLMAEQKFTVSSIEGFTEPIWEQVKEFWDIEPSWQNSIDSISSLAGEFNYAVVYHGGRIIGYGIIEKRTGDIPQFGVSRKYRGKGVGKSIIAALINGSEAEKAAVLNVDERSEEVRDFLVSSGFEHYVSQYEMVLNIK